ncbi:hypothetical protein KSF_004390 [Reticulibacter mediterranei]|uniref:histidine kinase n=1 Tax=Reticulibacter mediterranei TaxID=2778369 RepID=A0A8J3IHK6_9CHLR|nr:PAS domain-containing sensor histidine kinase [Reticulibacter mediterranei]GHO90391.1 hypothetical protein KSF_004390 [Reticulibacter mediterranei]
MSHTKQTGRLTPAPSEMHLHILEGLPGALFVVDNDATIVYSNAKAQAITGTSPEALHGNSFWNGASQLVSTALYQAVQKTKQTQEPTEVEYVSATTNNWLHVSLSPTDAGLAIFFQDHLDPPHLHDALSLNEQMYRGLLESFADGVTILTPNGLVLDINQRPLSDARLRREEVVGKLFTDLPAWSYDSTVQQQLHSAIARASRGETVRFEARIRPRTDLYLDILMTITSHRAAAGQIEYLICAGRDITERKHAEDELRALVDALPQFVWIAEPDGAITYNNHRLIDYLAMTPQQVEGTGWLSGVHSDDRQRVWETWQLCARAGIPYEAEHRLQDGRSNTYRWFLVRGVPQKDAQGTILRWVGTCTDIEEQKRAEERIKASEQDFRLLAEAVPQLVWTMWPDGRLEYTNQLYQEVTQANLHLEGDEIWRQFVHPEDIERTLTLRHEVLKNGKIYENEYRLLDGRTGTYHWFLARALPVRDEAGQVIKWFGTTTDIDEQKRLEEALRQSQQQTNALMNSDIIGMNVVEGEQIVDANDTFLHMTGYTREDLRAGRLNVLSLTAPEDRTQARQAFEELAKEQALTPYEKEYLCKDGSRLPVLVGGAVFQHHPLRAVGFVLDNSARKELEQRKDDFISMASHELRNPLTALKLQTTLLRRQFTRQGILDQASALVNMESQIHKITRLVEELLDVSKIQAGRLEYAWEPVDLDALLREIAETVQQTSPGHRILVQSVARATVTGDRDWLGQVFTNLLSNAIKYSPGAETVEVDLCVYAETVTIQVRDHGLGIAREQRDKIFERFYRVADPRQKAISGLGLGLYIVAEIVTHHGGTITVESAVGKGSTFTVAFPKEKSGS